MERSDHLKHSQLCSLSDILKQDRVAIPLEKFSYASSPSRATTHKWTHDTRADQLCLVFQRTRLPRGNMEYETRLTMRVEAALDTLENIDVAGLIRMAREHDVISRQGTADIGEQLVQVVIKAPCIAVRYSASVTLIRRFQLKFKDNEGYMTALNIFLDLELPVRNSGVNGAFVNRGPSNIAGLQLPALLPPHSTSHFPITVLPAKSSMSQFSGTAAHVPYNSSNVPSSMQTSPMLPMHHTATESPFFTRPQTASLGNIRPGSAWSTDASETIRPLTASSYTTSSFDFKQPTRPASSMAPGRPSASFYISQIEKGSQLPHSQMTSFENAAEASHVVFPGSYSQVQTKNSPPTIGRTVSSTMEHPITVNRSLLASPFVSDYAQLKRSATMITDGHENNDMVGSHRRVSLPFEATRPTSAPISNANRNLAQDIPPKRDLPFPKPRQTKPRPASADIPQVPELPPAPKKPTTEKVFSRSIKQTPIPPPKPVIRRIANRKSTRPPPVVPKEHQQQPKVPPAENVVQNGAGNIDTEYVQELSPLAAKSAAISGPSNTLGLQSKAAPSPLSRKRALQPTINEPAHKVAKVMIDASTQTQTLSGRDHTAAVMNLVPTPTHNNPNQPKPPPSHADLMMSNIYNFISKLKDQPASAESRELWEIPGWVDGTDAERDTILNDFTCKNLEDENFLKLVDDLGNSELMLALSMRRGF